MKKKLKEFVHSFEGKTTKIKNKVTGLINSTFKPKKSKENKDNNENHKENKDNNENHSENRFGSSRTNGDNDHASARNVSRAGTTDSQ